MILLVCLVFLALGARLGWGIRDLIAERDQYRAEEERDARWDAEHLTRTDQTGDAK